MEAVLRGITRKNLPKLLGKISIPCLGRFFVNLDYLFYYLYVCSVCILDNVLWYAAERTRTSTGVSPHGPEPCASANSATTAYVVRVLRSLTLRYIR